jgi:hypothetical protein
LGPVYGSGGTIRTSSQYGKTTSISISFVFGAARSSNQTPLGWIKPKQQGRVDALSLTSAVRKQWDRSKHTILVLSLIVVFFPAGAAWEGWRVYKRERAGWEICHDPKQLGEALASIKRLERESYSKGNSQLFMGMSERMKADCETVEEPVFRLRYDLIRLADDDRLE